ncbi:hypothetical protein EGW08_002241 [Elysia chlorotica]|uniref:Elongator complex protein 5 n=1 Tax=Elysia chlorotica TaxID=188477 RepID=A0A3S1A3W2_ELYCH|nr:hypothetical protein EGW08_002241 [Elysia chlorotica]
MLEDLLKGLEKSRLVLITDSVECNGRHLLLNWVESALKRCEKLVLLCFERPPDFFLNWIQPQLRPKLVCIDGNKDRDESGEMTFSLAAVLETVAQDQDVPSCVVVDSLTLPILMRPTPVTCRQLHRLTTSEHVTQVVALVHRDVTDQHACGLLEHQASTVLDLLPSIAGGAHACHIRHCRHTGKVFRTKESFAFDESFHIERISPVKATTELQKTPEPASKESDPTADLDLSFKLQLSDSEREARSQVVLPYLKDGSTETSTSKILYEADEADDFDEEDPDDDLNI